MTILTKNTTVVQDIILAWSFGDVADWHDGLIEHMVSVRVDTCYEEARQLLVDNGSTSIPASKEDTIALASNQGLLLTMAQKSAASAEVP
tara:strand:+ start:1258 stop:1527 length:270 start_codon:yes stop_codon:yes gene_type:complete